MENTTPTTTPTLAQQAAARDAGTARRSGDFVHNTQEMDRDFSNVSARWIENGTTPIQEVAEATAQLAEECTDIQAMPSAMTFDHEGGKLRVPDFDEPIGFTERGLDMIATWLKVARGTVHDLWFAGDEESREIFARLLNRGLARHASDRTSPFLLRLRGAECRAVFSDRFQAVDNDWVVETLGKLMPGSRVSHLRADGDSISGMILIPDSIREEQDSDYGGGVHFANSEVGESKIQIQPAVFRAICQNGCIWGEAKGGELIRRFHTGNLKLDELATAMDALIRASIPLTTRCIDVMLRSKEIRLTSKIDALRVVASARLRLTQAERRAWVEGWLEEGRDETAFGLIQGLTRSARHEKSGSGAQLERMAGDLCGWSGTKWHRAEAAASDFEREELNKVLTPELVTTALS
ncbi:MAG: DUF932 domain-containing protein [Sumerlaeia bacterium]